MSTPTPLRKDLPPQNKWDLTSLFASDSEFETKLNHFLDKPSKERWSSLTALKGTLNQNASQIEKTLQLYYKLDEELTQLYTYSSLKHDEDLNHEKWKNFFQKINFLYQDFSQNTAWIEPELLALDQTTFENLLKNQKLSTYFFYLQTLLHKKEFTLSTEKEELLSLTSLALSTPQKTFSLLNNVDMTFGTIKDENGKEHSLTHSSYRFFQRSSDRTLRKNSFIQLHQQFLKFQNTFAELLMGHVQHHIVEVRAKGYQNCLMAALYPKNIPSKTYHNLIQTVRQNIKPLHDYVLVRKQLLQLDQIYSYDLQMPPTSSQSADIPYAQAVDWIVESVAPLGEEYQKVLKKGLTTDRWVDSYENLHKRSGAYSSGSYRSHPYILMNYKGTLSDVFTLAHEAGHSMHTYLSNQNQPYQYARYPIFVAEVASIFNESLLMDYLLKNNSLDQGQMVLLHERLEEFRGTLFRQTMFAEFELYIHDCLEKDQPLTALSINEYYLKLLQDYYGPHLSLDPEVAIEWARVPHFYYNFYVYQYATGISAALTLAQRVLKQTPGAKESYLKFLKQGGHAYPIDLLKIAGIDMESKEPIETALNVFKELVDKLKLEHSQI